MADPIQQESADLTKANPNPGPSIFHDFYCTHDPCQCTPTTPTKETTMQTYVFTVAITGKDVQDAAEAMRERVIEVWGHEYAVDLDGRALCQVTESVRVTP